MSSSYNYYTNSYQEDNNDFDGLNVNEEKEQVFNFKDCILFAVDCSESMLKPNAEGDTPILVALKSIRSTVLNKVNGSRPQDQVGVVLYGTRESNNTANRDHIYIMQTLDMPDAPRVKEIDNLIEDISSLEEKFGSTNQPFSIGDLFWICSDIMSNSPKFSTKRIFLITDNDDPIGDNPQFRKTSIQRAKDLSNVGIEIILFGLDKPANAFDTSLFYKNIATFEENDDNVGGSSGTGKLAELLEKVKSSQVKNRSEFRIPIHIAPHLTVGVRGYNMVIEQKLPLAKNFYTLGEQVKEVKSTTRWECADTSSYLTPIDIKHAYDYGGEKVVFTKQELKEINNIREPSLLVLGFKSKKTLKPHHQISHPYFIYPDDSQYENSNNVLFSLLDVLLKRDRIAICSFVRRVSVMPKIVALIPQAEKLDENGKQNHPPGFQLIILPYAEEIRDIPAEVKSLPVDKESREAAKVIMDKMKIQEGFNPMNYENPYIQNHKNIIQKLALEAGIDKDEKSVDHSVPNYAFIDSNLGDDIEAFKQSVGLTNIRPDDLTEYTKPSEKRKGATDEGSKKRVKMNDMSIEELWAQGSLENVTNQFLKDFLNTVSIKPKRLKADMIAQIDAYLKTKKEN